MALGFPDVGIPQFELALENQPIEADINADIRGIEVSEEMDRPAMLSVTLNLWDGFRQKLKEDYFNRFRLGAEIKLALGINKTSPIFAGKVDALEPSFGGEGGGDTLTIRAYDWLHLLTFAADKSKTFNGTDSEIVSDIAREVGLECNPEPTGTKPSHITRKTPNNLMFLLSLAKRNGYEVTVDKEKPKTLLFKKKQEAKDPAFTLEYRKDLIQFTPRLRALAEGEVKVQAWDPKNKTLIVAVAGPGDETSKMGGKQTGAEVTAKAFRPSTRMITNVVVVDEEEAKKIAEASFNELQLDFVEAEGECPGTPELRVGQTIEIANVGQLFSGIYYVTSVTHKLGPEGYRTQFKGSRKAV